MNNVAFCDGGLCNRLNALVVPLVLRARFGGDWEISWPVNNWCGARFERLFEVDLPVVSNSLLHYRELEKQYQLVMHENQCNFMPENIVFQSGITSLADYGSLLKQDARPMLYYHHLIPSFVNLGEIQSGLRQLRLNPEVYARASSFCQEHGVDTQTLGLHIRKTDFGDRVDDQALFQLVEKSPNRFFVCSDDAGVNERFATLPNCVVFKKTSFPEKLVEQGGWNATTVDAEGRVFTFNITRSEESIVEALIDLLILSRTTHVSTSGSTFLNMSMIFKGVGFFAG